MAKIHLAHWMMRRLKIMGERAAKVGFESARQSIEEMLKTFRILSGVQRFLSLSNVS
jgi:hypothetical protein